MTVPSGLPCSAGAVVAVDRWVCAPGCTIRARGDPVMIFQCLVGQRWWVGSGQARFDECPGGFVEMAAAGGGDVTQGPLPGKYCQPMHRGPDRVFDPDAALRVEHAGVDQLVEYRAELIQRISVRPCGAVRRAVS